ncbi:Phytochrome-like protein cph1 [Arthrobacter sp. SO5]|uniref:sensor histidine kinase n=1 Tax=Arthrobacter sp. SO5 TaxID=1897055 RepID=UPI001E523E7C|nr:GAF domain-containing sensor histidine kinase [Arthrobacter sp. SO5]MCB5273924.1 Phytochrome-like protein cph1 [Arthrobacter sp. SO5]
MLTEYGLPHLEPVGVRTGAGTPPDTLGQLQKLLVLATSSTGIPSGVVNIITADQQHHIAAVGIDPGVCSREDSMCARVFLRGETTVVPDASRDPLFHDHPFVTGRVASIRFYASVPLITTAGFALGSLCVFSPAPAELSPDQQTALEIIAAQVVEVLELQHHARMLARSLAEARNSNALLESFAGRISHDLRNPLTSVIGFTELGELRNPAEAEDFRIIGRTSRRMLAMVDDILSFSRIGGALRPGQVSLAALVHGVEEDLAFSLGEAGAEIRVSDVVLQADPEQLRMFLQNLIQNAVAYRRPDVPPRIRVTAEAVEDGVAVRVTDNGKGIPAEERGHVTEPLVRLHRADDPPGFGLGLATCVRIAQAHGGRLEISSAPDGGTTVSLILPVPVVPGWTPAAATPDAS